MSFSTSQTVNANDDDSSVLTFVDYTPGPQPQTPPPAKYKLWILILVLVYFAEWFAGEAGLTEALGRSGYLSPTAALFFTLALVVFVLVFATLDLVVAIFTIEIKGRSYGLGPWLKQGRFAWIRQQDSALAECVACLVQILEDGFSLFNAPPALPARVQDDPIEFSCSTNDCSVVLKIEHRIDPTKLEEYSQWQVKINKAATRFARGLMDMKKSAIVSDTRSRSDMIRNDTFDEEEGAIEGRSERKEDPLAHEPPRASLHTIHLKFENIDYLNDWMTSPKRRKLVKELKPLLAEPDIVQIQKDRNLPDAFTDLLIRQGECVPVLTPKKWKVWWLTLLGLFFVQLWTGAVLPYYFAQWKLDKAHKRLQSFVLVFISTFLSSYVLTPLLLFLFSYWVQRKENENDTKQPWKILNDGFESVWTKGALTVLLYGGFAIAWIVKSQS